MLRRRFLASLLALPALPRAAWAARRRELSIGIYPGTGKADIPIEDFRSLARPFANALGDSIGANGTLMLFRSIRNTNRAIENGRMDVFFVPPAVASIALDHDYSPVARVQDEATGMLVRLKGAPIRAVALTEKASWLDVMGRYVLHNLKEAPEQIFNLATQEEVRLAMERGFAQAGSLREKVAGEMIASGKYEVWHPLPRTPDFTLIANNRLSAQERDRLGAAAAGLSAGDIQSLQKTIHSKVSGFKIDKSADYQTIKQALELAR